MGAGHPLFFNLWNLDYWLDEALSHWRRQAALHNAPCYDAWRAKDKEAEEHHCSAYYHAIHQIPAYKQTIDARR